MARAVIPPGALATRPGPDLAAFADAQERLREVLGVDAVFIIAAAQAWPPGTPLDPETGRPYDPFLDPVAGGVDGEVTVRCSFVHHPLTGLDPAQSPIGAGDLGDAALLVPLSDYQSVKTATRVRVGEELWTIQQFRYDVALTVPRWIAYLERA